MCCYKLDSPEANKGGVWGQDVYYRSAPMNRKGRELDWAEEEVNVELFCVIFTSFP